jgi:hypothetical protein
MQRMIAMWGPFAKGTMAWRAQTEARDPFSLGTIDKTRYYAVCCQKARNNAKTAHAHAHRSGSLPQRGS